MNDETPVIARRIPSGAAQALEEDGEGTLREAADVAGSVHGPGGNASQQQPGRTLREAEALRRWSEENGLILPAGEFDRHWEEGGEKGGSENAIYLSDDGTTVFKRNNLSFHSSYLEFFERIALHNYLFPHARLHFVGFTEATGHDVLQGDATFQPVISQDVVESMIPVAGKDEINEAVIAHMKALGFKPTSEGHRKWDWYDPITGVVVEDLHDENVIKDYAGRLVIFDPVIYPVPPRSQWPKLTRLGLLTDEIANRIGR